jgi:hypothetical protein
MIPIDSIYIYIYIYIYISWYLICPTTLLANRQLVIVRTWLPYEQAAKKQNKALLVVAAMVIWDIYEQIKSEGRPARLARPGSPPAVRLDGEDGDRRRGPDATAMEPR